MSQSEVVEARYRIHAADLQGRQRKWVVSNISYQGVEDMAPVLHIEGMSKRFVLDPEQSRQMMSLTNTLMPDEWVGATIRVAPVAAADSDKIVITAADLPRRSAPFTVTWTARLALTALLIVVLVAVAYAVARFAPAL